MVKIGLTIGGKGSGQAERGLFKAFIDKGFKEVLLVVGELLGDEIGGNLIDTVASHTTESLGTGFAGFTGFIEIGVVDKGAGFFVAIGVTGEAGRAVSGAEFCEFGGGKLTV